MNEAINLTMAMLLVAIGSALALVASDCNQKFNDVLKGVLETGGDARNSIATNLGITIINGVPA